tara:strand:+ start:5458 stop:5853 length:396 start_codon:yes stop_codon:yes gene_type:complete
VYAKIADNKIVEQSSDDHEGESGWMEISESDRLSGINLVYDSDANAIRQQTAAEAATEFDAVVLSDAWEHLRRQRNGFLRDTDEFVVADRPATTNMLEYRVYLRGIPAEYNDVTILSQTAVMDFDAYVASL